MELSALSALSASAPIINATITLSQRVFELKAVSEQTRDLLETSAQITQTLSYARALQTQKAPLLSATEKLWVEEVLISTERALNSFAALMEPARVDMQTSRRRALSFSARALFVLRDSPKVSVNLSRLNIAVQHLNTVVGVLSGRNGVVAGSNANSSPSGGTTSALLGVGAATTTDNKAAPPTYEESQFLNRRRSGVPSAAPSVAGSGSGSSSHGASTPQPTSPTAPASALQPNSPARHEEGTAAAELAQDGGGAAASALAVSNTVVVDTGLHVCTDWEPYVGGGRGLGEATVPQAPAVAEGLAERTVRSELRMPAGRLVGRRRGQAWLAYQTGAR